MSRIALPSSGNAIALYNPINLSDERIESWFENGETYNDPENRDFIVSIDSPNKLQELKKRIEKTRDDRICFISRQCLKEISDLKTSPILISKSVICGTLGGMTAAQTATLIAVTSTSTPAVLIGSTVMVCYYQYEKSSLEEKIKDQARLSITETAFVAKKITSFIQERQWLLQAANQQEQHEMTVQGCQRQMRATLADLTDKHQRVSNGFREHLRASNLENINLRQDNQDLQIRLNDLDQTNITLDASLNDAKSQIDDLNRRDQATQANLSDLNQKHQAEVTATAQKIDALQRENAQNLVEVSQKSASDLSRSLAVVQRMNHELLTKIQATHTANIQDLQQAALDKEAQWQSIEAMRAEQDDRQAAATSKQIVQRGVAKALSQEQEEKINVLSRKLAVKASEVTMLRSAHDQAVNRLAQKFDVMTQTMTYNPTESSVSELMRSQRQDFSEAIDRSALLNELTEAGEYQQEEFEYVDAPNEGSSSSEQLPLSSHSMAYGSYTSPSDASANYHMGLAEADIREALLRSQ